MRKALWVWLASALLAAAPAAAQTPAPDAPQSPERPALKLKLEEPIRGQPRITFGPRDGKGDQRPADTLPALGGNPSPAFDRPVKADPDSPSSPYPKDTNPVR